jgi:hypothetical protein
VLGMRLENINEKQKIQAKRFFYLLLLFCNLTYLSYLVMIAYYNRLALDDYCQMGMLQKHGLIEAIKIWYNQWSVSVTLKPIYAFFLQLNHGLFLYVLLLILLFVFVLYRLFVELTTIFGQNQNLLLQLNLAVFTFAILFNTFFEPSTFFWLIASVGYCFTLACCFQFILFFIKPSHHPQHYIVAGFCAALVGNGSINIAFTITGILVLLWLYTWWQPTQEASWVSRKKIVFVLLICMVGITITLLSPGMYVRKATFPEISILETLKRSTGALTVLSALIQEKLKYFLILLVPFIYVGTTFRSTNAPNDTKVVGWFVIGLPLVLAIIWVATLPTIYAVGNIGPHRSLTHLSFYLVVYVAIFGFMIGYYTLFSKKLAFAITCSCFFYFGGIGLKKIKDDVPQVAHYAKSYDQRLLYLQQLKAKGHTQKVVLPPLALPNYNIIVTHELSKSPDYWVNGCMQDALQLKFEVAEDQNLK